MKITYFAIALFTALAAAAPQRDQTTEDAITRPGRVAATTRTTIKVTKTTPRATKTTTRRITTRITKTTIVSTRTRFTLNPPNKTTESCTLILCADAVNECGLWYGGCYPACPGLPTPTFIPPPCPTPAT
ncbi:hypothetical protein ABW20_dc0100178 [Dactylellina cionopaga]|nr:hypothetical protein ABW20_dc0100178 [Dactylellina cionopaga]